jgi:hypothetical protein
LPVLVTETDEVAIVIEVGKLISRILGAPAGEEVELVVAVEVVLEFRVAAIGLPALKQEVLHAGIIRGGEEGRKPIEADEDLFGHGARLNLARPADQTRRAG